MISITRTNQKIKEKIIRTIIFIFDVSLSSFIAFFFILFIFFIFFLNKIIPVPSKKYERRILFMLTLGVFEELQKKGVSHMFLERDENGYFDHVYSIHIFTNKDQHIKLNERHTIIEFGGKYHSIKKYGFIYLSVILTCFYSFPKIYKMVISEKNCILRATEPYIDGLFVYLLGNITGVSYCVSLHADYDKIYEINKNLIPMFFGSIKLTKMLGQFVLSHTQMVLPISNYLMQYAIRNGAAPESIRIIPHGVNISKFQRKPSVQFKNHLGFEGKKLIVYAGRLSKEKYIYDIIESAKNIVNKCPNAIFLLIGDGPEKYALSKLIQEYNLEKNVILMGFLSNENVIEIESIADVNICPLAGFSLIEAGLSGNPVIAYNVEWHSELVINGESGFLIDKGDFDTLADSIMTVFKNPELGKKMGEKMKTLIMEKHSLDITSKIKISCYEDLFKSRLL